VNPQIILTILQGVQLAGTIIPSSLEAALKLKEIFAHSGSDFTAEIVTLQDGAVQSAQETIDMIDAWKKAHGLSD
jgi:hypothetical protein